MQHQLTHGQPIRVIAGRHAGKTGWFNKENPHRPGKCFIWLAGPNQSGGHVDIANVEAVQ